MDFGDQNLSNSEVLEVVDEQALASATMKNMGKIFSSHPDGGASFFASKGNACEAKAVFNNEKSILLVGPGRHFGKELLLRFAREGYRAGFISGSEETAELLHLQLAEEHVDVICEVCDINNSASFSRSAERLAVRLKNVDCLIYNAKMSVKASGLQTTVEDLTESLAVNVTGALVAIKAILPYAYLCKDCPPSVILTGGGFKDTPDPDRFALSVGKSALHGLARSLKEPLGRRGVLLKTLVIDGYVRKHGPITPESVADYFWHAHAARSQSVFRISRLQHEHQQTLFDEA